jgi:hypothetical protein
MIDPAFSYTSADCRLIHETDRNGTTAFAADIPRRIVNNKIILLPVLGNIRRKE